MKNEKILAAYVPPLNTEKQQRSQEKSSEKFYGSTTIRFKSKTYANVKCLHQFTPFYMNLSGLVLGIPEEGIVLPFIPVLLPKFPIAGGNYSERHK